MKKSCISIFLLFFLLQVVSGCVSSAPTPNPASYHYQMGLSYLGEGNYSSALFDLTEAEKLDPENPDLLYNLGKAFVAKKRPDLAEAKFLKAILLRPGFSVARNDLGVAYLDLKRWDDAIQQFKIVKDDLFYESSVNASINLGLAYLGKGYYPKAFEELQKVVALNPRKIEARLSLGRVLFAMNKSEQAISEYNKALLIYPDYGAAHYYLGEAELKLNRIDAARVSFREVLRLIPETELGRAAIDHLESLK